jgi:hypothetical protein
MRTTFFLFAMLANVVANAAVTVTPLSTDYATKKVTFKVAWTNSPTAPYNNRVWIWIDFCPISGVTPQRFSTATITSPVKTGGNGTITNATARGFFIEYNTTNAGTTITATLSNASGQFNWCAYGSDYPPNATVNAGGGYTLRGTKPFTINGNLSINAQTFGAGTCITSIADLTSRPDGFATPTLTIGSQNSPSRCSAGTVSLSVIASGGTTTAMTYTWTIGSTNYTTTTNSYTTNSLSASTAYTVKVKNANNCESATVSGNITVNYPGTTGQPADATCGCANGNFEYSSTCYAVALTCESCKTWCLKQGYSPSELTGGTDCSCFPDYPGGLWAYMYKINNNIWAYQGTRSFAHWTPSAFCR